MIDRELFAQQMGLLAGRIGRTLDGPVFAAYYASLSKSLTNEEFLAATTLAFETWDAQFRNWPSPAQFVAMVKPAPRPELSAAEAFERVLDATNDPRIDRAHQLERVQALGATAVRAFRAAGGFRDFGNVLESDVPWVRKRFVEAYEAATENAAATESATMALAGADDRVTGLIAGLAKQKALLAPKSRQGAT